MEKHPSHPEQDLRTELNSYVKKHLKEYIVFNLTNGYELHTILRVLRHYGYHDRILRPIVEEIPNTQHHVKPPQYNPNDLSKDARYYLEGVLVEYVGSMLEHGYTKKAIRQALINYGHHPGLVHSIFLQLRPVKTPLITTEVATFGGVVVYGILAALLLLALHAPSTGALLFVPGALGIVLSALMGTIIAAKRILPIIQAFLVVLFYIGAVMLLNQQSIDITSFDTEIILGVNVLMSTIISVFLVFVMERKKTAQRE